MHAAAYTHTHTHAHARTHRHTHKHACAGGALLGDVDAETGVHRLAAPLGHAPPTGMGLVLNGGFGIASRKFGLACSNVLSFTLVTADGSVVSSRPPCVVLCCVVLHCAVLCRVVLYCVVLCACAHV